MGAVKPNMVTDPQYMNQPIATSSQFRSFQTVLRGAGLVLGTVKEGATQAR